MKKENRFLNFIKENFWSFAGKAFLLWFSTFPMYLLYKERHTALGSQWIAAWFLQVVLGWLLCDALFGDKKN